MGDVNCGLEVSQVDFVHAASTEVWQVDGSNGFFNKLLVLLCYKQSQAPSVTKRAGGELLDKMSGNLNS